MEHKMSDLKSKLPDMNEIGSIAGKFYKDIKKSVLEIIDDFKQKHPAEAAEAAEAAEVKEEVKKPVRKAAVKKEVE